MQKIKTKPIQERVLKTINLQYQVISVGIDVSKDKLDVGLWYADRRQSNSVFDNDSKGINKIISLLQKQGTAETVPCIIESTGNYHLRSAIMITQAGFCVKVINPLITKRHQKSSIRNAKSDPIDARRLAEIGLLEPELPVFIADKGIIGAKKLVSYLASLDKEKQRMTASLKQLRSMEKELNITIDLSHAENAIKAIKEQIKEIKTNICESAPPEAKIMSDKIPGLAEDKIAVILTMLRDKQFDSRDKLVAFFGMDIALRKSGKWQGREKLTKRGEPISRKTLYLIAWALKTHHPEFKKYYDRIYHEDKKHYTAALMAVARKFLKLLYAYYYKGTVEL